MTSCSNPILSRRICCVFLSTLFLGLALSTASASAPPRAGRITVSGVVVASHQATLSCRIPARIASVKVTENTSVHRGQMLVQLDDTEVRGQLNAAIAALAGAKALEAKASAGRAAQQVKADLEVSEAIDGLQQARHKRDEAALASESAKSESAAEIKAAQQSVDKATMALARASKTVADLETLNKVGGVSRNDLDAARMQEALAQYDLDSAVAGVNRVKQGPDGVPFRVALAKADFASAEQGVHQADNALYFATSARKKAMPAADSEVRSAHASVLQAQASVKGALDALTSTRLVSPIDGIASVVSARTGETAQPGAPLVTVVSLRNVRVEALVLSRNIPSLRIGMHASVSVDTLPGRALDAVVSEISSVTEPDQRSIRVRFRLTGNAGIRPGLAATVVIGSQR